MNHFEIAQEAIQLLTPSIQVLLSKKAKRNDMHIVVMNPTLKPWECSFEDALLYEYSLTEPSTWEQSYDELAKEKARQAWSDGRGNMYKHTFSPATLKKGDVAFYGSFEYEGVIVAASGVEPWFDVLVSGWVALAIQQLAQSEYHAFKETLPMAKWIP